MENRFLIACCVFCFISGMYVAHMLEKDMGCIVSFSRGNETHILIGKR